MSPKCIRPITSGNSVKSLAKIYQLEAIALPATSKKGIAHLI